MDVSLANYVDAIVEAAGAIRSANDANDALQALARFEALACDVDMQLMLATSFQLLVNLLPDHVPTIGQGA
ncbi:MULTISPECIES: hypothetical protein [Xanthomonas]|uniref:hypothetical protein n=1 Tax=Xanthomonas TaxID=338 RepID=UPI0019D6FE93|nr:MULTISPECIES: hypothetical protein [Xanthomonas]MCT8309200.1 hypothetical protein [Xanthomonas translucens pv. translucens]QSQ54789.1 hypothetical protein ISN36_19555 [Xanthomonas translucens pv. undulosa]QSQ62274.1 hypothetical protein ISN38_19870 [Xanthomonas translucens pv. undulosa]WCI07367.1 hypothetical protein PML25_23055 [Xanthomonas hortorum pv. pelargonii]WIH07099.1 hypothetical protein KHF85_20165 [Xanthomonas translucens pv. graminis]